MRDEHACFYCGFHAEQIDWTNDELVAVACCASCMRTLMHASRNDVPTNSTRADKQHYLRTMHLLGKTERTSRPIFTTAIRKTRYPIRYATDADLTPSLT